MSILTAVYSERNAQVAQGDIPIFIPTVFVGLGGSGKSVLMRLRKQFHDRFTNWGSRFDRFARFVFVDTDRGEFAPRSQSNAMFADVIPRESEVVESTISRAEFQRIFDNLEMRVESDHLHWLKPSMRTVGPGAVEDGAGTHRQFGRLAFFVNYAAIRQQIKAQIEEVLAYATKHATEVAPDRIEVVVVTSLAGGTGSGMFLDVAYLVRDLLSHPDYDALRIKHVTIVAFLPEMFRNSGESLLPRFRQNAYAALLELEYYGTARTGDALYLGEEAQAGRDGRHGFRATWPGRGEVFFADRGWDTLFLVDNVNNLTRADPLSDAEVFQMTADYLFLDFGHSRFATEKRTARSNLVQYKDRWKGTWVRRIPDPAAPLGIGNGAENVFATQNGCIYSSFGLAEIFFDVDNLYQAAGYRLASRLVRLRWIGSADDHSEQEYLDWATRDLLYPARLEDQSEPPPSFHPDAIARRAVVSNDRDWLASLEADLEAIEQLGEEEAAAELGSVIERHRERLAPGGEARKAIAENVAAWTGTPIVLGPWRRRLQFLGDEHLSEDGVEATKRLLLDYRATLLEARQHLVEAERANLAHSLLSRLEEAKAVPFPVRQIALRIELAKARAEARTELHKHYAAVAKADAEPALVSTIRYIGEPGKGAPDGISRNAHGTVQEWMDLAAKRLEAIADRLNTRFSVASMGRDLVNHRKQSLTVVWDERRYDRKINQALLLYDKVGRDPEKPEGRAITDDPADFDFEFDWVKLERLVLEQLPPDPNRELGQDAPARSIADLLRFWETHRLVNQENVEKIAQRLAVACEAVIRAAGLKLADVEHGNVADLLSNVKTDQQRRLMIEQLVTAAAPYLPTTSRHNDGIQPAHHNLFGLSVGSQATSPQNVKTITELVDSTAATRQSGGVAGFGDRLEAEQSSALFVRMMAGFPLQDYTRLEELYKAYKDTATNTRSNDECHLDYKQSWEDLPDIRAVGPDTYSQVRENVDIVLLNMMIGVISYPKDRAAFYVLIPDPYGAGEDYHRLGKRISRAIKHACDDTTIRNYLADRWSQWSADATVKAWACLYESALRTLNESRREITVEAGRIESVPFRNCYGGLLRMIGKKLSEVNGGQTWLEAMRPRSANTDGDGRPRPRPTGLDGALKRIHENLKIYQIIPAKVESVALPEPDAVAPSA
jgi:hypothetical protein